MAQSSTKKVAKKAVSKKAASKKTAAQAKAPAAKKTAAKKTAAKAESESKPAAKKSAAKKTAAKKVAAKSSADAVTKSESAPKKAAAKKTATKKIAAKTSAKAASSSEKKDAASASTESPSKKVVAKKAAKAAPKKKVSEKKPAAETKSTKSSAPAGPKITVGELEVPDHSKALRDSSGHYMSPKELEHFQQKLADWKQQLMEEVDRTVGHMKDDATNFPDPNDRATQEEEFSLELRTRDRERKLIKKINEAQKRIDDLEYGYCETCGVEIGVGRLEARPTAELCIDCKTLEEVRERQTA